MTSNKSTKRALISSALAIFMCVTMLMGTTFAWFTDNASSGVNKIQAGNLDIEVEYTLNGEEWEKLDEATDLFGDGLFEPGYTRVVAFRISNKGNLALKYNMSMNLVSETKGVNKAGEEFALSDYLKVKTSPVQEANYIGDVLVSIAFDRDASKAIGWNPETNFKDTKGMINDNILSAGQQVYFIMQVYMPESVGNEANAISTEKTPSIDFGINFAATQATVESDSYNNQYDKDALYYGEAPEGAVVVSSAEELKTAVAGGATTVYLKAGTYDVAECKNATLTINGLTEGVVIKVMNEGEDGCDYGFDNSTVIFNGVTIDTIANTGNYKGYARMAATFNNCEFVGAYAAFKDNTFNNCTFDFQNGYFWTWGAETLNFSGCTFNGNSKAILAHGGNSTTINIVNCAFAATEKGSTSSGDNTAAVEMDPTGTNTYTVNFSGNNTITEAYAGWTRVKDNSTGHIITGLN